MSFWSGRPKTPPLETHFFGLMQEVGGGGGWGVGGERGQKTTPPLFGSKLMNLLVFFNFEPKKCFRVPTRGRLYGPEWDER